MLFLDICVAFGHDILVLFLMDICIFGIFSILIGSVYLDALDFLCGVCYGFYFLFFCFFFLEHPRDLF